MNRLVPILALSLSTAFFMTGCAGYQLGAVKPSVYAGIDRLHVPPFRNDTLEPRLSSLVTNAVLKQIQVDGTYQVSNRNHADAVLVGRITRIHKYQLRATRTDTLESQELGLNITAEFYLEDPVTGDRIYGSVNREEGSKDKRVEGEELVSASQGSVQGSTIQFVDPSFQVGERTAMASASEDLARKLVNYLANGW